MILLNKKPITEMKTETEIETKEGEGRGTELKKFCNSSPNGHRSRRRRGEQVAARVLEDK